MLSKKEMRTGRDSAKSFLKIVNRDSNLITMESSLRLLEFQMQCLRRKRTKESKMMSVVVE